ncbi:MAG: MOSC domain-containing protein [Bauldia sp.]|nr:MOSC domain-containing protein [Bauldia sp.]
MAGRVVAVAKDAEHRFSKITVPEITIVEGLGVDGDAHQGVAVKHRSRVRVDPTQPNLRQVHLIQSELFAELRDLGFVVGPAELGENITTARIDLLALPRGAILRIGQDVRLEVTGLRNPCAQIESFREGLLGAILVKAEDGTLTRKAGIMTVVRSGGVVKAGDAIAVDYPQPPFLPLERV